MNLKLTMPTIVRLLIKDTFNPQTKLDCGEKLANYLGISDRRVRMYTEQKDMLFITGLKVLVFFNGEVFARKESDNVILSSAEQSLRFVESVLITEHMSKKEYAAKLGVSYVGLMHYFKQPNIKAGTLVKMFNALDYDVFVKTDKQEYVLGDKEYWNYVYSTMYSEAISNLTAEESTI